MSIQIYQPSEVSRWRRRLARYATPRTRGLLFEDTGGAFLGLSIFADSDTGTYIAPLANPTGGGAGSGSGPGCCCCECQYCKFGTSPALMQLFASGIDYTSIVGACFAYNFGTSAKVTATPANPNGTFSSLNHGTGLTLSCCAWGGRPGLGLGGDFGPAGQITTYSDVSCTTSPSVENLVNFSWAVTRSSGLWQVTCTCQSSGSGQGFILFYSTQTPADGDPCDGTLTFSNQLTTLGAIAFAGDYTIATGGSVVISPA